MFHVKPQNVLILPGWQSSGPEHWQSRWEARFGYRRVEQHDWMHPQRGDWMARLEDVVLDHVAVDGQSPLREIVAQKYPTGAFAVLEFDIDSWADIEGAAARLVCLTRPRDLDPTLGPEFAG